MPDPTSDPDHPWPIDDAMTAHLQDMPAVKMVCRFLGPRSPSIIDLLNPNRLSTGSEIMLAIDAPTTTKCFCGIGVPHRCVAVHLSSAHPHGMSNFCHPIQSTEVYECFDDNAVKVEILLGYLGIRHILPRHIYGQVSVSPLVPEICASSLTSH